MKRTFLIPDAHGRFGLVYGLLNAAGIITSEEEGYHKAEDVFVVSIGDLANCTSRDIHGDLRCVKLVEDGIIDLYLVGNHEHPYITGDVGATFSGFKHFPELEQPLRRLYFEGKLQAAMCVGDVLVTHAGLGRSYEGEFTSAGQAAEEINETWRYTPSSPLFTAIPMQRGGRYPEGGVLWLDWMEAKSRDFNQVVGHTPQKKQPPIVRDYKNGNWSACIDWGGKLGFQISGCWLNDDGSLDFVYFTREEVPSLGFYID